MRIKAIILLTLTIAVSVFVSSRGEDKPKPKPVYFLRDVMPLLTSAGCNAAKCHGSTGEGGGLYLSMFGADARADFTTLTRVAEGREINMVEPARSLFVLKPTASISHGGGQKIKADSPEYKTLVSWIEQGARWGDAEEPELVSVKLQAKELTLEKGKSQQLKATAVFSDGMKKDVTGAAQYYSSEEQVAAVGEDGKLKAQDYGQAAIIVTYMRKHDLVRIVVPQPLDGPFPDFPANNKIDELVAAKLKELGIPPSDLCSDQEFLRRVYLDAIGTLPTPDQARAYLSDSNAKKRSKLIDELLERDEFADYWTLKWGDLLKVKSEYPSNLWPNAVQAYHRWIWESIARNKPYDQFARELIVSGGSNFRNSEVNFYRAFLRRTPQQLADAAALIFMGARLGCASCHGHPVEEWTREDNLGMAAFFAKVGYKKTQEWKEEIIYFRPKGSLRHPRTRAVVKPAFLDGETLYLAPNEDPRVKFAEWLTSPENPWFAKNIVNRIWFWLLGRGIVHQVDDLRPTNPPQNPELLAYLEKELIGHKYDLKHIYRLILNSRTYQLSSKATKWNSKDVANFSHYMTKRLGAEQLLDAIGQVTETSEKYVSRVPEPYTMLPAGHRAVQLSDGSIGSSFLELFGRPPRDTAYESERNCETSMRQALHFINSRWLQGKVAYGPRLKQLLQSGKSNEELVTEVYLLALSRLPTESEKQSVLEYIGEDKKTRTAAMQDFVWAILNTKEFMFNH